MRKRFKWWIRACSVWTQRNSWDSWNIRRQNLKWSRKVKGSISHVKPSAGGWRICNQMESGTWYPLPGTLAEEHLCRTGKLCRRLRPRGGGGKARGTTLPRLHGPAHLQGDPSWAQALCSGWPSLQLPGTKADPSGMCFRGSPDSLWLDPLGCPGDL